jgi:Na+/proline symporter
MGSHADVVITLLATSLPALVIIAGIGLYLSFKLSDDDVSTQSFICANGKAGTKRLAGSFVAASLGSWVVMRPGYYGASSGILGLCVYAVCLGAPLLLVAACGKVMMRSESSPTTLAAFIRNRFNSLAETYIAALVFFNTAVLLLTEYSSLIAIFRDYVDASYVPVLLAAGGLSLLYTVCGGFRTTMAVNTYQCAAISVCSVGLAFYFMADFRPNLPEVLTTEQKGFTAAGYSTLAIFPLALFSSAMFNEGLWQVGAA